MNEKLVKARRLAHHGIGLKNLTRLTGLSLWPLST